MSTQQAIKSDYQSNVEKKRKLWLKIIKEWQLNPINSKEFCLKKGLNYTHFSYWRHKFTNSDNTTKSNPQFVEVTTADTKSTIKSPGTKPNFESQVNITLQNNVQLLVTIPTLDIAKLAAQLGDIRC